MSTPLFERKTIEEFRINIKVKFNDEYEVVSPEYSIDEPMQLKHKPCGYDQIFRKGSRFLQKKVTEKSLCPICYNAAVKKNQDKALQYFFDYNNYNYTIIKYEPDKPLNQRYTVKCNKCGYTKTASYHSFKQHKMGCNCNKSNPKYTDKTFKDKVYELVGDDYTVLDKYINSNTKIRFKHNCLDCNFYVTEMRPRKFVEGQRCYICSSKISRQKPAQKLLKTQEKFLEETYDNVGTEYTPLESYINSHTKIYWKHNTCGHIFRMAPNDFNHNKQHRCTACAAKASKKEKRLVEFIKSIYNGEVLENRRNIIKNEIDGHYFNELDIYIPERKLAIEFDGIYHHNSKTEKFKKYGKRYHYSKTRACYREGIRLIHIFEDEWDFNEKIVKSKISNILGCSKNLPKIRASDCYVKEFNEDNLFKKNEFLNDNHIQGGDKSLIKLGLWYPRKEQEDLLVAVMTFKKPAKDSGKNNEKYDYELSRFASDINYRIYGAFAKLFKYFKENYEWKKIITYADLRWSNMNYKDTVYYKQGFNYIHSSKPTYFYVTPDNKFRESRRGYQKKKLKKKFPEIYDDNLSEVQIMQLANYALIYDCGTLVFEYNKE